MIGRSEKMVKISIKADIPDEFIEIIMKEEKLSKEEVLIKIRKYLERFFSEIWLPLLRGHYLYKAGLITYEEYAKGMFIASYSLGKKITEGK
jgi:hypothetical protein